MPLATGSGSGILGVSAVTGCLTSVLADFGRLATFVETTHRVSAGAFMAATICAALYSPVASSKGAFRFPEEVFGRAGSIASHSKRTR
jgi:hypothetical protein